MPNTMHRGVVRGRTIELENDPGLPDGQSVTVVVQPAHEPPFGEGLRRSFGAWADEAEELDEYLEQCRRDRRAERRSIDP